jgi:hypothetical protein
MPDDFQYDVFLCHGAKNKAVVRPLAERLREDEVMLKVEVGRMKAEVSIHPSSFKLHLLPVLCMSANALGSDWALFESGTFRFRESLNKERRVISLLLPESNLPSPARRYSICGLLVQSSGAFDQLPAGLPDDNGIE